MTVQSPTLPRRTERRRVRLALVAALVAVMTLSGCYKADVKVSVNTNDTLTGDIFIGVSPTAGAEAVDSLDPGTIMTIVPGAVVTDAKDDTGYRGRRITFTDVPMDSLANPALKDLVGIEIKVRHEGEQYILDGSFDGTKTKGAASSEAPTQIHASFTFPGPVGETNGTVAEDGRTVSWAPAGGEKITMNATAADKPANQTLMYAAYAGGALVALVVAFLLWRRFAPAPKPAEAAPAAPAGMKSKKQPKVKTRAVKAARTPVEVHQAAPVRQIVEPPKDWWDAPLDPTPSAPSAPVPHPSPGTNQPPLAHGETGQPLYFGAPANGRNDL